jgi:hypothetical protein
MSGTKEALAELLEARRRLDMAIDAIIPPQPTLAVTAIISPTTLTIDKKTFPYVTLDPHGTVRPHQVNGMFILDVPIVIASGIIYVDDTTPDDDGEADS